MRRYKVRRTLRPGLSPGWAVFSPEGYFRMTFYNWSNAMYWANKWHEREYVHALNKSL